MDDHETVEGLATELGDHDVVKSKEDKIVALCHKTVYHPFTDQIRKNMVKTQKYLIASEYQE